MGTWGARFVDAIDLAADRFVVVSKGEEEPLCSEESDACHARNRRGHFVITAK
ncbi:hypothetical protein D3C83_171690 [compost metagenome]